MIENFKIIKEIDGLSRSIDEHMELITKENERIQRIKNQIQEREEQKNEHQEQLDSLIKQLTADENELSGTQTKLESKKAQRTMVFTDIQVAALEKELESLSQKQDELEESIFSSMEKREEIEEQIKDATSFAKGASSTLLEIETEVLEFTTDKEKQIGVLELRIKKLIEQLPVNFKQKVETTLAKKLRSTMVATISAKHCNYCQMQISGLTITEVEDKHQLKTCPQCSRILMPGAAAY